LEDGKKVTKKVPVTKTKKVNQWVAKPLSAATYLANDPRRFEQIDMIPQGHNIAARPYVPADVFNSWSGFGGIQPEKDSRALEVILDFYRDIICDGNEELFIALMMFFAHILQFPHLKPNVCLVFYGPQRTGKNMAIDLFRRIVGNHNVFSTSKKKHAFGQFNVGLLNKLLLVLDETLFNKDHGLAQEVKDLVTNETYSYEIKKGKMFNARSCHRIVILTNQRIPVIMEPGEGRNILFYPNPKMKNDLSYWKPFVAMKLGQNDKALAAFYHYLLQLDVAHYDFKAAQQVLSKRDSVRDLKEPNLSIPQQWLADVLAQVTTEAPGELIGIYDNAKWLDYSAEFPGGAQSIRWEILFDGVPLGTKGRDPARGIPKHYNIDKDDVVCGCTFVWPSSFPQSQVTPAVKAWAEANGHQLPGLNYKRVWAELKDIIPEVYREDKAHGGQQLVKISLDELRQRFQAYKDGTL
jgi:hypothetical protein